MTEQTVLRLLRRLTRRRLRTPDYYDYEEYSACGDWA